MSWLRLSILLLLVPLLSAADLADELADLTGYVILSSERIDDFEGCEYGKIVQFDSRAFVTCEEYGYQYAYSADAVILVRHLGAGGRFSCKMAVEDEIYDIDCNDYVSRHIAILRSFRDKGDERMRAYADRILQTLGVQK